MHTFLITVKRYDFTRITITIPMTPPGNKRVLSQPPLFLCIIVVLMLYLSQGIVLGLISTVPVYLASFDATWKQQ
ncbi:unnamed protein product, partial [Rotaria magnacalcarata]